MTIILLFSTLVLSLLSTKAAMSMSGPRRLGQTQALGGRGGSSSGFDGGIAHARAVHQSQQNVEAIKATMKAYPPRKLQTTERITFDEFCSIVSVSI